MLAAAGHAPQRPFVLVHPGATAPSRRYPPELYGRAMDDVVRLGWPCIFCAGEADRSLAVRASEAMVQPALLLTDAMPLGVFGALIEQAAVLVANNSGPAHMAAAVGTPVVCLYALTNPQHTPWLVRTRVLNHEVPCRDCLKSVCPQGHHACLLEVTPGQVSQATLSLLSQAAARSGAEVQPVDLCHEA